MNYAGEPQHSDLLTVQGTEPFNAEPLAASLVEFDVTPEDLVYCRNHGPVLDLDEEAYGVTVNGAVDRELSLSMHELRTLFPQVSVVAALQVSLLSPSPVYP